MNKYTRKLQERAKQERQRALSREDEQRLKLALKAASLPLGASPRQEQAALEKYIASLRKLKAELVAKYGNVRELIRIDIEIGNALEQIARVRITELKPGVMR